MSGAQTTARLAMLILLCWPAFAQAEPTSAWMTTSVEAGRPFGPGALGAPRLAQSIGWYFGADRDGLTAGLRLAGEENSGMARAGGGPWVGYTVRLGGLALGPTVGASYIRSWSTEPGVMGGLHGVEGYAAVDLRLDFGALIVTARPFSLRGFATPEFATVRGEAGLGVGLTF